MKHVLFVLVALGLTACDESGLFDVKEDQQSTIVSFGSGNPVECVLGKQPAIALADGTTFTTVTIFCVDGVRFTTGVAIAQP